MESNVKNQIQELEQKIQKLRSSQVGELEAKLKEARQRVADIEAEIEAISGKKVTSIAAPRRKRTSSEEVRGRIMKVLAAAPEGLGQKEIADAAELNYNTVVLYLKNNAKKFKTTGSFRSKRYFLR